MEIDRTFRDVNGIEWRVSHVPAQSATSPADHGWLAFEAAHMERRLAPFPETWRTLTLQRLEQMCRVATAVEPETPGAAQRRERAERAERAMRAAIPAAPEPIVDATPAEGAEVVLPVVPVSQDHVSVLANAYPARESRFSFRG